MCSSGQLLCTGRQGSHPPGAGGSSSGSQYAFCALGVGLVALGVVMILWSMVPIEKPLNGSVTNPSDVGSEETNLKTSSVAFILVGVGLAMLLLAVCLSVRSKQRRGDVRAGPGTAVQYTDQTQRGPEENEQTVANYDVPSYEEAVTSGQYPIRQSNLRQSTSQLPSYEDLITAVENEGEGQNSGSSQNPSAPKPKPVNPQQSRSGSRASLILRPLIVRRIMSEKLHVKDIRLNIQSPPQGGVTIEPLTPPPQYEDKPPEFPKDGV
ncbi:transmembrane protein 51b [Hoplias malabaricus]|uniref:transmembrane protein 51b n=1 Tax=Hoplias malabaricus TaxID=27720 RepID=UPI003461E9F0